MPSHRRSHRVGRGNPPVCCTAKPPLLFACQCCAHRGIGEDMHKALLEKPETLGMAIDRHDNRPGMDHRLRCTHFPAACALCETDSRAVLENLYGPGPVAGKAGSKRANIERRLQHYRSRQKQVGPVEMRACHLRHRLSIKPFVALA